VKQPQQIPGGAVFRLLIPTEPRHYSGQRWVKMSARAAHVVLSGVYLGAFFFEVEPAVRSPWFLATLLSGLVIVCLDLYESGAFLLQLRGLVVGVKLVVVASLPVFGRAAVWVLAVVAFVSVISSHASSSFRYYQVWGRGRIKGAETKG
jgi:hypothetical protein